MARAFSGGKSDAIVISLPALRKVSNSRRMLKILLLPAQDQYPFADLVARRGHNKLGFTRDGRIGLREDAVVVTEKDEPFSLVHDMVVPRIQARPKIRAAVTLLHRACAHDDRIREVKPEVAEPAARALGMVLDVDLAPCEAEKLAVNMGQAGLAG